MMPWPRHPVVYEINTWVWLAELSRQAGGPLSLAEVPDAELDHWEALGFDAVWLMGVWQRSPGAREVARTHPDLQPGYRQALPDYTDEDVVASPYAVHDYRVDPHLGGDEALAELRQRLARRGLRLMLDFVPNHLALDHPWVHQHPERFVQGDTDVLQREPHNYYESSGSNGRYVLAHGRDPYFPGWTDTVQLDYRKPITRRAMADQLLDIAGRCDGVRCDMAMLVNREVFGRTWGGPMNPPRAEFWPAAITDLKARYPDFLLLAEVYWDMGWEMQQLGVDYAYDKRLYDRLWEGHANPVRLHLLADWHYQRKLCRFVENHDEQRAMAAFGPERSRAAALLTLSLPGLRLVHEKQLQGYRLRLPVQLGRRRQEPVVEGLEAFYRKLLTTLRQSLFHEGIWRLLEPQAAGGGHDGVVAHLWQLDDELGLCVVNLAPSPASCRLPLSLPGPAEGRWRLQDQVGELALERSAGELLEPGFYLELEGFGHHLLRIGRV